MTDNLDVLLRDLALKDSGFHRHENPQTGAVAFFPDVPVFPSGSNQARQIEAAWEARALVMHESQDPIRLEPKPLENTLAKRVVRAD